MKITSAFIILLLTVSVNIFSQSVKPDTVYFCREYKGKEIGNSKSFAIGLKEESITVMLRAKDPVKDSSLSVKVEKVMPGSTKLISNEKFDVQPSWDYIFFADIKFDSDGLYRVSVVRPDGTEIADNTVTMVSVWEW